MSFLRVFIKRPAFTTMLVFVLVVFGLSALPRLGIDLLSDVDFPIVAVVVTWDGASPEEMENLVAKPIENAVSAVSGIKTIKSTSRPGLAQVVIEFVLDTDPRMAAADVRERWGDALPDQIDEPTTQRYDMTASPIVYYSLYSDQRPRGEICKMANDIVKDHVQQLDGVGNVSILGGSDREIQVRIAPRRLDAYGLTLDQVISVVNSANANTPGGYVKEKGYEMVVRTLGQFHNVDEIVSIAVASLLINFLFVPFLGFEFQPTGGGGDNRPVQVGICRKNWRKDCAMSKELLTWMRQRMILNRKCRLFSTGQKRVRLV